MMNGCCLVMPEGLGLSGTDFEVDELRWICTMCRKRTVANLWEELLFIWQWMVILPVSWLVGQTITTTLYGCFQSVFTLMEEHER